MPIIKGVIMAKVSCDSCKYFKVLSTSSFADAMNPGRIKYWCEVKNQPANPSDKACRDDYKKK